MPDKPDSGAGQLQDEIMRLVEYHAKEYETTAAECVLILETVKLQILLRMIDADHDD